MTETYFGKIVDVLPSRVVVSIPSDRGEHPILRTFDVTPLVDVVEIKKGSVIKITIETNPGEVIMRYAQASRAEYKE